MNVTKISLTVLAAAFVTAAAAAPGDRFPIAIADVEERTSARFAEMDQDGDQTISLNEFESAKVGHRSRPRHGMRHRGPRPQMEAAREAHEASVQAELFAIMDSNEDGVVSDTEHANRATRENRKLAERRATFKRLDADNSGYLDANELPSPVARLKGADADGDGLVTREEMHSAREMRPKRPA